MRRGGGLQLMAKGPRTDAPKLMSPVILRNLSIPLNDFVRLLEPMAQYGFWARCEAGWFGHAA